MKKLNNNSLSRHTLVEISALSGALFVGALLCLPASAQTGSPAVQTPSSTTQVVSPAAAPTPTPTPTPTAASTAAPAPTVAEQPSGVPLNLSSDDVAKEISKENHAIDAKLDALSTTPDVFAQSILDSENRNKISGMVEAGAGVGSMPVRGGGKSSFTCENTAAAINDQITPNTQIGVYAQVNNCNTR